MDIKEWIVDLLRSFVHVQTHSDDKLGWTLDMMRYFVCVIFCFYTCLIYHELCPATANYMITECSYAID